jgi:hypothetical protein
MLKFFQKGLKHTAETELTAKAVGSFLLISKKYDSSEPEELKVSPQDDIELVWVKIKTLGTIRIGKSFLFCGCNCCCVLLVGDDVAAGLLKLMSECMVSLSMVKELDAS